MPVVQPQASTTNAVRMMFTCRNDVFIHGSGTPRWWRGRPVLTFEPLEVLTLARESPTELVSVSKSTWIEEVYQAC